MSDFNPDVEFLGLKVAAGKSLALTEQLPEDDQTEITHRPHITNVALGPNPKPGRHTVFAQGNGMKAVVGTLEMGRCEQFQVDLVARDIVFSHTGKSDVYLTGYNTMSAAAAYFDDMSEEDDDEESEDDEDVPNGVPMQQQQLLPSRTAKAMQQALIAEEADEEDDDDEEDDSDDDDDDEEEDSDDEVDEEAAKVQMGIAHLKKALTSEPLNGKEFSDMEDDDMEDDDEEEDEDDDDEDGIPGLSDDDEDDSSEDDEDEAGIEADLSALLAAGGKRSKAPAATAQPAKKAKVTPAAKPASVPAAAPKAQPVPTTAQPGLTGPLAAQWLSALKTHLTQSGGETDLSKLGGVKKPEGVPKGQKLKAFLLQHPKTFSVDGNTVKMKK